MRSGFTAEDNIEDKEYVHEKDRNEKIDWDAYCDTVHKGEGNMDWNRG